MTVLFGRSPYLYRSQHIFARMPSVPLEAERRYADRAVRDLTYADIWNTFDVLTVCHHAAGFVNWRRPHIANTPQNSPDIQAYAGTKGNGVGGLGILTFVNPTTLAGANLSLTSATIGVFSLTDSNLEGADCGSGSALKICSRYSNGVIRANLNTATATEMTVASSVGMFLATRTDGDFTRLAHNDTISDPIANVATQVPNANFTLGFAGSAVSNRRLFCGFIASGWDNRMIRDFYTIMRTYFDAVNGLFETSITLEEPTHGTVTVAHRMYGASKVYLSGTLYSTTSRDVQTRFTAESGGATVMDWTTIASGRTTGPWSGLVPAPPTGSDYKVEVRTSDAAAISFESVSTISVSARGLIMIIGDSTGQRQYTIVVTPAAGTGNIRRWSGITYPGDDISELVFGGWPLNDSAFVAGERGGPYGGDGTVLFQNLLESALGEPLGILPLGFPGTTASQWIRGGQVLDVIAPNNMWQVTDNHFTNTLARARPRWNEVGAMFYWGGVADAHNGLHLTQQDYEDTMSAMLSQYRAQTENPSLIMGIHSVGASLGSQDITVTDESINLVRQGQLAFWDKHKTDGVVLVGTSAIYTRADDVGHWIYDHQMVAAALQARAYLYALGEVAAGAEGPQITSVSMTGNSFTITVTHTALGTLLQGLTGDTGLTAFRAKVDASIRAITSCEILSATTIGGTFDGAAIVSSGAIDYLYGRTPDATNPVFDDDQADGVTVFPGMALQPSRGWVTATVV